MRTGNPHLLHRICQGASIALLVFAGCAQEVERRPADRAQASAASGSTSTPIFVDGAREAGLDFVHFNGMSGEHYISEMMGGGAALFDYDNDGDLDLYLTQGRMLGQGKTVADASFPPQHPEPFTDRLYRNDLRASSTELRFTDVTESSGTLSDGYGMGVTAADFDNDGWIDLYVTNFRSNRLLRNQGDGTFEDVTEAAGADDRRWSVAATFLDFDRDGWLDLFVGNYVQFSLAAHTPCPTPSGAANYCGPGAYQPARDSLFRNRGDGTFENVSNSAGIRTEHGAATLGAVATDFDADGWIDLFVANDSMANYLWLNQGDGRFQNQALLAGVAVNQKGQPEASMGVDAGDFDADGDADLILTHLSQETNTVYVNDGTGLFEDLSTASGLGLPSLVYTSFGAGWFDYDNDGWLDVLTVNGAVVGLEALMRAGDPFPLHQTNQLFRNFGGERGAGRFEEVTARAGIVLELSEVSRGAAFGDVDNDGDTDVVVVNNNGPVRLLLNQIGQDRSWVGLRLEGRGRDMLGAEVLISPQGRPASWRRVHTDGSYASASDPRVLVGLGDAVAVGRIEARWPDGAAEEWLDIEAGSYTTLRQGEGSPLDTG
ncbi:MAG: CRTAC1 family protein [bacterium]|nr:CRTAC1 family protein [bacterium]